MNDLVRHLAMVLDGARVEAYRRALAAAVRPGARVADVGTGSGVLAVLACRAGAGRVYAVEPSPLIGHARELVAANGVADRVTFVHADAADAELPEPVDLVVADLRGTLPLRLPQLRALAAFRRRWLTPGGTVIPRRDLLWVAPCRNHRALHHRAWPADGDATTGREGGGPGGGEDEGDGHAGGPVAGIDLSPLVDAVTHTWWRQDLDAGDLLGEPRRWGEVVWGEEPGSWSAELAWELDGAAEVHGLAVWFEADLGHGSGFSTAPSSKDGGAGRHSCYGQAFFPLPRRLATAAGDRLAVHLRADPTGDHLTWSWEVALERAGRAVERVRRSTFHADAPGLLAGGGAGPGGGPPPGRSPRGQSS